jgi:transcriptional regulator with XRE-family HTH domain
MRAARERLGLPQDRLGVMIGIDEGSASARMSRYETGVHEPPVAISRLIALALRVPLAYLYCDDDDLAQVILKVSQLSPADRAALHRFLDERVYGTGT